MKQRIISRILVMMAAVSLLNGCAAKTVPLEAKLQEITVIQDKKDVSIEKEMLDFPGKDTFYIENLLNEAPYVEVNGNVPQFTEADRTRIDAFETYSDLDYLGRCGVAYANICQELMPTEKRGEIGQVKPSGWNQKKYEGIVDSNPPFIYNRCHLIGYQLAGENANEKNLITGTRYFNVVGMLPFENKVADYVKETGNHVLYRVTPIFVQKELLCRGILMEAFSVEDNGKGMKFCVFCPNVQPGVTIDYATGESFRNDEWKENDSGDDGEYILNTRTMKYHLPTCSSVVDINPQNKENYAGSRNELADNGYSACKRCIR